MKGVYHGYGKTLSDVAYNTPDHDMLANLRKNVYQFSAAKNHQQVKELTQAIADGDRIRSFTEFKTEARKILDIYNVQYMETEYNTAIAGGQMAGKWVGFTATAEQLPYLKYETVGDSRVREEHRLLDGVVKVVDSPFWNKYYPPNGWNCRCTVIQLPTSMAHETLDKNITLPEVPKMFQVNTAKENIIFPEASPYFENCPNKIKRQALKIAKENEP